MSISFSCSCGHSLSVPDSKAGASGRCPRCAATVRVPSPAVAATGNGSADAFDDLFQKLANEPDALEMEEGPAAAAGAKANPPCPKCGTEYEPDVVICVACGLHLLTGQPIGHGPASEPFHARRSIARDETDLEAVGFGAMTLGVLLRPLQTMENFAVLFTRHDILAKSAIFYVASFVAVAVASLFAARPDRNAGIQAEIEEIERVQKVDAQLPPDWIEVSSHGKGMTEWGEPLSFKLLEPLGPVEAGKSFTVRVLAMEPGHVKPVIGTAKLGRTPAHGNAPGKEWYEMKAGSKEGEFVVDLPASREGGSSFVFSITCRPGTQAGDYKCSRCNVHVTWTHKPGWGQLVREDRNSRIAEVAAAKGIPVPKDPARTGGIMGAVLGGAVLLVAISVNVLGLLISAAIFTGAARLLGGGGGFVLMLVTMAYLTGFTNFLQFIVVFTPLKLQIWLQIMLMFYGFALSLCALMKVYDIDALQALLTTILAFAVKLAGAAWVVMMVLKVLGVA